MAHPLAAKHTCAHVCHAKEVPLICTANVGSTEPRSSAPYGMPRLETPQTRSGTLGPPKPASLDDNSPIRETGSPEHIKQAEIGAHVLSQPQHGPACQLPCSVEFSYRSTHQPPLCTAEESARFASLSIQPRHCSHFTSLAQGRAQLRAVNRVWQTSARPNLIIASIPHPVTNSRILGPWSGLFASGTKMPQASCTPNHPCRCDLAWCRLPTGK